MKFLNQINAKMLFLSALLVLAGFGLGLMTGLAKNKSSDEADTVYAVLRPADKSGIGAPPTDTIYGRDVLPAMNEELASFERGRYDAKKRAVEEVIKLKIAQRHPELESQAASAAATNEVEITAAELQAFLKERGINRASLTEKQLTNVQANMRFQKKKDEAAKVAEANRAKYVVQWKIPLPSAKMISLKSGEAASLGGSGKVKVQLVSNFHCAPCATADRRIEALKAKYGDRLEISFHFLMTEPDGSIVRRTAEASLCANDQKKFWAFYDAAVKDPAASEKAYLAVAELDTAKFEKCVSDRKHKVAIEKEIEGSINAGLTEAPAILINGRYYHGAAPLDHLEQAVDADL